MIRLFVLSLVMQFMGLAEPAARAEPIDVQVYSVCCYFEQSESGPYDLGTIDRYIFDHSGQLKVKNDYVSRIRAWREIGLRQNICTTQATQTDARHAISYFSRLPHSVFPPIRLIVRAGEASFDPADPVALHQLLSDSDMIIGVVSQKDYGPMISGLMAQYPKNFFSVPSQAEDYGNLINILLAGRIDGFLGDAQMVDASLLVIAEKSAERVDPGAMVRLPISGLEANLGYLACAKTDIGRQIMNILDATMAQPEVQEKLPEAHLNWFPDSERSFLRSQFRHWFSSDLAPE